MAGRKRCVSKPFPLLPGMAFGVPGAVWARTALAPKPTAATAAPSASPHRAEFRLLRRKSALATRASVTQEPRTLATATPPSFALLHPRDKGLARVASEPT